MNTFILISVLLTVSLFVVSDSTNPGVKLRITQKALDYVNVFAQKAIHDELGSLDIPNQSGNSGHFSWSLTSIQNLGVTSPKSHISLDQGHHSLAWSLSNFAIRLRAHWRVHYRHHFVHFTVSGEVDVSASGVSLGGSIGIGKGTDGRPTLSVASCTEHIPGVSVHFHGSVASRIINWFHGTVERKIKSGINGKICNALKKVVNVDVPPKIKTLPVSTDVAHDYSLDYRLVEVPTVNTNYLETSLKGTFSWKQGRREPPFSPKQIPASGDVSKMLYIWLTDYTLNTLGHAAYSHDKLVWDVTFDNIGHGITSAGATVKMTSAPKVSITSGHMSLSAQGHVDAHAMINSTRLPLMTLNLNINLTLQAQLQGERLTASISHHTMAIKNLKIFNGINIGTNHLNQILEKALTTQVFPRINGLGHVGL